MANEITAVASLAISQNNVTASGSMSISATLNANNFTQLVQTCTATGVSIGTGGVTAPFNGWCFIKNIGSAGVDKGSVTVTDSTGIVVATLLFGEACLFKPAAAPFIKSLAGTSPLPDAAIVFSEL